MGTTEETRLLQDQIKQIARKMGWSQNKLAREIYLELNDWEDDCEIKLFQERLKKDLQRHTTKPEKLREYLAVVSRHRQVKRSDLVLNKHVPGGSISESLRKGMARVSKEIDFQTRLGGDEF